jgi:3'-phosphoadenosine 5'-phosphosulfate sulfotransferase (PAPS reductase)/FAD synthetase
MQRHFQTGESLCEYVAGMCPDVVVSFSLGKDSIGAWVQMRRFFRTVKPFYMYLIPDLGFVEDALRYYEDRFQVPIVRMPHPSLYRMLSNLVFQAPERCHVIENADLATLSYDGAAKEVIGALGWPKGTFTGHGTRCADSLMRRASVKKWGSLNPNRKTFMPIWDWNADRLCQCFRDERIKLPVDYEMFGRSFDGIDERFLRPIHDRFPADYAKILEWFPLADLELKRMDWRVQHAG